MHSLEVVVLCQGLISGLLMTPGGSELVRSLRPRTRPEVREPGVIVEPVGVGSGVLCVCRGQTFRLISLRARLFTHHPPDSLFS